MASGTLTAFGVIALASVSLNVAALSYDRARELVAVGEFSHAEEALDLAVALDPSMALYVRERGALAYARGRFDDASAHLEHATQLNMTDDLAWRTLGLAYLAAGRSESGHAAFARAMELQRSDLANVLLSAQVQGDQPQPALRRSSTSGVRTQGSDGCERHRPR